MRFRFLATSLIAHIASTAAAFGTAHAQVRPAPDGTEQGALVDHDGHASNGSADLPGDIIVTAQRRSERVQDVPLSITALSGETLAKQGIVDVAQLQRLVPGFSYQQSTLGVPIYSIRGIGFYDTSVTASPTVTTYVDQIPLAYSAETRGAAFDVERVEVLKGPQGTLFGLNATGGAVNFVAAKPTERLKSGFTLDVGRFDSVNAQAFVSGPLTSTLKARLAVRNEYRGDWQRGYAANDSLLGKTSGDGLGRRRFSTGRFLLDWQPNDAISIELNINGWKDRSDTQAGRYLGFYPTAPADPFNSAMFAALGDPRLTEVPPDSRLASWDAGRDYARDDYFYQASLNSSIQLNDAISLHSVSAYSRYRENSLTDPDGLAYPNLAVRLQADIKSYYQELRLSGEDGRLKWMLGGNYAHDDTSENQTQFLTSTNSHIGPFPFTAINPRNRQTIETIAGFGGLDYRVADALTVQVSARYTDQKRDYSGCLADAGDGSLAAGIGTAFGLATQAGGCLTQVSPGVLPAIIENELNEHNLSWRGSLSWKPGPDSMLYVSASKGYKAGGFSVLPAILAVELAPATQESVLSYETGFKMSLAQRRVQLTGAVFYSDYRNKQITGSVNIPPFGSGPILLNIPRSRVYGAELEATVRAINGLTVSGGVTYVNSKIRENPSDPLDVYGNPASFVGEAFPNTPRWQGVVDAEYGFRANDKLRVFAGGTGTVRSSTAAVLGNSNASITGLPALVINGYSLLDLRAGIEAADGSWRFQIWGRNVTDRYYVTNRIKQVDTLSEFAGMPATYGMTLSFALDAKD